MNIEVTQKQQQFLSATQDEVLFGGAAGGGKSYAQMIDALLYGSRYPRSKQLLLRRTYPELERSLIRESQTLYPRGLASYNGGNHIWTLRNGSIIEFGHLGSEADVGIYQSAEYDVIRFDELTHFTEYQYTYMMSRVRGANGYPKQMKSTTNPSGVGHAWVKERFIDPAPPLTTISTATGTRVFIPAKVQDNQFLMASDPTYLQRLNNLPEAERKALRDGSWDLMEGRYFTEWQPSIHVMQPFTLPKEWQRVFCMDYGLDMLAGYWVAMDTVGNAFVYKEVYQPNLIISDAAKLILERGAGDEVLEWVAPPDLWNRRQDTGRSVADIFADYGIYLRKASNDRVQGLLDLKEWLKPIQGEAGTATARLRVFDTCRNLIRCLPSVIHDPKRPNDMSNEPHELTHSVDALRYFVSSRPQPTQLPRIKDEDIIDIDDQINSLWEDII